MRQAPRAEDAGEKQRDTRAGRTEAQGRPDEERQLQRQRRAARQDAQRLDARQRRVDGKHPGQRESQRHGGRLAHSRCCFRAPPPGQLAEETDDSRYDGQFRQHVAEKPAPPDQPVVLTAEPRHGRGVGERREERRRKDGGHQKRHETPQRVEALRRVAEEPRPARGDDGLEAIREKQRQDQRGWPVGAHLHGDVRRERRQQQHRPPPRLRQQKSRCEDGVRRPEDGRCGRGKPELQSEQRPGIVGSADRQGRGDRAQCLDRPTAFGYQGGHRGGLVGRAHYRCSRGPEPTCRGRGARR